MSDAELPISPVDRPDFITEDGVPRSPAQPPSSLDPAFDRDRFLLRQKLLSISEKYDVWNAEGQPILYMERPAHFLRNLGALLPAIGTAIALNIFFATVASVLPPETRAIVVFLGIIAALFAALVVGVLLSKKRHVTIYRDKSKQEPLLKVLQVQKFEFLTATYILRDTTGDLARFRKNYLYDLFRKQWQCYTPAGTLICTAKEDSLFLAILRRYVCGTFFGLLRINFILLAGASDRVIGEFNRKFTLLDRYVLDMSADPQHLLDRRIALALGVLLDTGERR